MSSHTFPHLFRTSGGSYININHVQRVIPQNSYTDIKAGNRYGAIINEVYEKALLVYLGGDLRHYILGEDIERFEKWIELHSPDCL